MEMMVLNIHSKVQQIIINTYLINIYKQANILKARKTKYKQSKQYKQKGKYKLEIKYKIPFQIYQQ